MEMNYKAIESEETAFLFFFKDNALLKADNATGDFYRQWYGLWKVTPHTEKYKQFKEIERGVVGANIIEFNFHNRTVVKWDYATGEELQLNAEETEIVSKRCSELGWDFTPKEEEQPEEEPNWLDKEIAEGKLLKPVELEVDIETFDKPKEPRKSLWQSFKDGFNQHKK